MYVLVCLFMHASVYYAYILCICMCVYMYTCVCMLYERRLLYESLTWLGLGGFSLSFYVRTLGSFIAILSWFSQGKSRTIFQLVPLSSKSFSILRLATAHLFSSFIPWNYSNILLGQTTHPHPLLWEACVPYTSSKCFLIPLSDFCSAICQNHFFSNPAHTSWTPAKA